MTSSSLPLHNINYTKIAGFFYSLIIILAFLPSLLLDMNQIWEADNAIAAMTHYEQAYRLGTAIEFFMYISVMVLSWALYVLLKPVDSHLALVAFAFRLGEALLGCVVIVFYVLVLVLLDADAEALSAVPDEQREALARFFLSVGKNGYDVLLTMMGIGAFIFCYLFYISHMIPKPLAVWGMVTYVSMILYGMLNMIMTDAPSELSLLLLLGAVFEFFIGLWLFFHRQ